MLINYNWKLGIIKKKKIHVWNLDSRSGKTDFITSFSRPTDRGQVDARRWMGLMVFSKFTRLSLSTQWAAVAGLAVCVLWRPSRWASEEGRRKIMSATEQCNEYFLWRWDGAQTLLPVTQPLPVQRPGPRTSSDRSGNRTSLWALTLGTSFTVAGVFPHAEKTLYKRITMQKNEPIN